MKIHVRSLHKLAENTYLRADFKLAYYHDKIFVQLKNKWKRTVKMRQIISEIRSGVGFSKREYADYETYLYYLRVNNFRPFGEIVLDDTGYLKEEIVDEISRLKIKEGEYIITRSGTVGIVYKFERNKIPKKWNNKIFIPSEDLILFRIKGDVDSDNIKYFLYSSISREYFESVSFGKSQKHISQTDISKWIIPLDKIRNIPINEIREKEHEISRLKAQVKEPRVIADEVFSKYFNLDLKQYEYLARKHVFKEDFANLSKSVQLRMSPKFHHPKFAFILEKLKEYKTVKLKQLLKEPVRRGVQPEYNENGGVFVIKTINISKEGYIDLSKTEFVSDEFYSKVKKKAGIQKGDILITSTGEGRGKVGLYNLDDPAIADTHISIVRCKEYVNTKYLSYFLLSSIGRYQLSILEQSVKGTPEIYPHEIEKLIIIYLSPEIQNKIVAEIEGRLKEQRKIMRRIEELKQEIDKLIEEAVLHS